MPKSKMIIKRKGEKSLSHSQSPALRKLAEYERACQGVFADRIMIISVMPVTEEQAVQMATALAGTLKEFQASDVKPLVMFEPQTVDGDIIDLQSFQDEDYDVELDAFFRTLKGAGVTDGMMGMWAPLPEANVPVWSTTNPEVFCDAFAKIAGTQKKHFPKSEVSVLLSSKSYQDGDDYWEYGEYNSLLPYVSGLPKGLVDSFGYQGFPWMPPADDDETPDAIDAKDFLRPDLAEEAAKELGVQHIWLNTGTFGRAYSGSSEMALEISQTSRRAILKAILEQAGKLQAEGFSVAIHIFAQDKMATEEAVDWSYWPAGKANQSKSTKIFTGFVRKALRSKFAVWLFDANEAEASESTQLLRQPAGP